MPAKAQASKRGRSGETSASFLSRWLTRGATTPPTTQLAPGRQPVSAAREGTQPPPTALAQALRELRIKYPFEDSELANAGMTDDAMRAMWACEQLTAVEVDRLLDFSDCRASSQRMVRLFVEEALNVRQYSEESVKGDRIRVPIAVNHGCPGSGKTTLLHQARHWFTTMGGNGGHSNKAIFATFNGDGGNMHGFDVSYAPELRIAHRLLHAAVNPAMDVKVIIEELYRKIDGAEVCCLSDPEVLVPALRGALAMGDDDHLLIAFDEVRKIATDRGLIHEVSSAAVGVLTYLGKLSQASFIHRNGGGVVLVVASALSAFDPKSAFTGSSRPIRAIPLPPVDPTQFFKLACRLLKIAPKTPRWTEVRAVLWQARFNARFLKETFRSLTDPGTPCDIKAHMKNTEARMHAKLKRFISAVDNSPVPGLLSALFWPIPSGSVGCFDAGVEMDEVLLADVYGICAILTGSTHTTVYMNPTVCATLCRHFIDAIGYTVCPPTDEAKASARAQRKSSADALCDAKAKLRTVVGSVRGAGGDPQMAIAVQSDAIHQLKTEMKTIKAERSVVEAKMAVASVGAADVTSLTEQNACLLRQHEALKEELADLRSDCRLAEQKAAELHAASVMVIDCKSAFVAADRRSIALEPVSSKAFLVLLEQLATITSELPSEPLVKTSELPKKPLFETTSMTGTADVGKLYERVCNLLFACRVGAARPGTIVGDLAPRGLADEVASMVFTPGVPEDQTLGASAAPLVFPRAARKNVDDTRSDDKESWDEWPCSEHLPSPMTAPWRVEQLHDWNVVFDSLLVVGLHATPPPQERGRGAVTHTKPTVCFGLQSKEHAAYPKKNIEGNRDAREKHMVWGNDAASQRVQSFLENTTRIQVFLTPNSPTGPDGYVPVPFNAGAHVCHETLLTHDDIRAFCPMVAYSCCDARVLQPTQWGEADDC